MSILKADELAARLALELRDLGAVRAAVTGAIARGESAASVAGEPGDRTNPVTLIAAADDEAAFYDLLFAWNAGGARSFDVFKGERDGVHFAIRVVLPERYGALAIWDTGNDAHLALLMKEAARFNLELDESGIHHGGDLQETSDEESAYRLLGLRRVPPEERTGEGELENYRLR
ncbi:MAG: hypothetical protein HKN20_12265 [Gemmatimonadetes bacterium]|nr:hypothetical protein [Gemmatimonadota bacterium]